MLICPNLPKIPFDDALAPGTAPPVQRSVELKNCNSVRIDTMVEVFQGIETVANWDPHRMKSIIKANVVVKSDHREIEQIPLAVRRRGLRRFALCGIFNNLDKTRVFFRRIYRVPSDRVADPRLNCFYDDAAHRLGKPFDRGAIEIAKPAKQVRHLECRED